MLLKTSFLAAGLFAGICLADAGTLTIVQGEGKNSNKCRFMSIGNYGCGNETLPAYSPSFGSILSDGSCKPDSEYTYNNAGSYSVDLCGSYITGKYSHPSASIVFTASGEEYQLIFRDNNIDDNNPAISCNINGLKLNETCSPIVHKGVER